MNAKSTTIAELGEMISHLVQHTATKDDLKSFATKEDLIAMKVELKEDIASIREEVIAIRRDLNDLMEKVENISGYRKEIDYALERIRVIEKQLGISK